VLPTLPTSAHALSGSGGGIIASPVALAAGGLAPRRPQPQQLAGARHGDPETAPLLAADNGRGAKPHSGAPSWPAGGAEADRGHRRGGLRARVQACAYVALNVASTCGIVFANKLVLSPFEFAFPVALTLLHALATAAGMEAMCRGGLFPRNPVPLRAVAPVALAYVGSIVTSNWSIQLNTVRVCMRVVRIPCGAHAGPLGCVLAYGRQSSPQRLTCLLESGPAKTPSQQATLPNPHVVQPTL
jgi:hypothetical protein